MPEKIAGICIGLVVLGTIYYSFGLKWPGLVKRLYWGLSLVLAVLYIVGEIGPPS